MTKDGDDVMTTDGDDVRHSIDWDTATPEQAFAEAQRRIAEAKASGAEVFGFNLKTLTTIPPEISQLQTVRRLNLADLPITDLRPLGNLHRLEVLVLGSDKITGMFGDTPPSKLSDITPLAKLQGLKRLYLGYTNVSDVAPLHRLSSLQTLILHNTPVSDISPLSRLSNLEVLDLSGTGVANLEPLSRLKALTDLNLNDTQVSELIPLQDLTQLVKLHIERTRVTDLRPLAKFTAMIEQWNSDEEGVPVVEYDYDEDDYAKRGLHYEATPIAARQPYGWFVAMKDGRRTIETINWLRSEERQLPTYWPEGYVPATGSPFDKNKGLTPEAQKILDAIKEDREKARRENGAWATIKRAIIIAVVGLIVAGVAVAARSLIKLHEAAVRAWIEAYLQGSRIAHWMVDLTIN